MIYKFLILFTLFIFISSCTKEEKYKCGGEIIHIKDDTIELTSTSLIKFEDGLMKFDDESETITRIYKITEKSENKFIAIHKYKYDFEDSYTQIVFYKKTGEYEYTSVKPRIRKEPLVTNHKCIKY